MLYYIKQQTMSQSNQIILTNTITFHKEMINNFTESVKSKEEQIAKLQDEISKEKTTISMITEKLNVLLKQQEEEVVEEINQEEVVVEETKQEEVEVKTEKKHYVIKRNKVVNIISETQFKRQEAYKKWKPYLVRNAKKYEGWRLFNDFLKGVSETTFEITPESIINGIPVEKFWLHSEREILFGGADESRDFHKVDEIARDFKFVSKDDGKWW